MNKTSAATAKPNTFTPFVEVPAKRTSTKSTKSTTKPAEPQAEGATFEDDIGTLFKKYKIELPSNTRIILGLVAGLVMGGVTTYMGSVLLGYLVIGAALLSGSAFVALSIYILGLIGVVYAALKTSSVVSHYVYSERVDRDYFTARDAIASTASTVRGWFSKPSLAR